MQMAFEFKVTIAIFFRGRTLGGGTDEEGWKQSAKCAENR